MLERPREADHPAHDRVVTRVRVAAVLALEQGIEAMRGGDWEGTAGTATPAARRRRDAIATAAALAVSRPA